MPRGGRRANAGRKPGSATKKTREIANAVASQPRTRSQIIADEASLAGLTPIEYMLSIVRDPTASDQRRDAMAVASAAYCHPRLAAVGVSSHAPGGGTGNGGGDINITQIYAVPRGAVVGSDGRITTIDGELVAAETVEPYVGTPALLTDESSPRPIEPPLPVHEVNTSNVTPLRRRDDGEPGAA